MCSKFCPPPLWPPVLPWVGLWLCVDSNWGVGSHPVGVGLYYEDQKVEAARGAEQFRNQRIPKFFG